MDYYYTYRVKYRSHLFRGPIKVCNSAWERKGECSREGVGKGRWACRARACPTDSSRVVVGVEEVYRIRIRARSFCNFPDCFWYMCRQL